MSFIRFIRCWDAKLGHEVYRITVGLGGLGSGSELCIWSLLALRYNCTSEIVFPFLFNIYFMASDSNFHSFLSHLEVDVLPILIHCGWALCD